MTAVLMKLEWLRLRRSLASGLVFAVALLASLYAVWSGLQWKQAYVAGQALHESQVEARMQDWRSSLADIESGAAESTPYDARPMDVRQAATHTPGALAHLAIGYRDIMPSRLTVGAWRNEISMVERYEFDNPLILALGRFDFAFFLIVVLPVLMIALSFDVIASDLASGRARLLLSNAVSLRQVILARLLLRNGLLCGLVLLVMLGGFLMAAAAASEYLIWAGVCMAYMVFWFTLIFCLVAASRQAEAVAARLLACWLVLIFAIPAVVDSAVQALNPPPSKLAQLSVARVAEAEAARQTAALTEGFLADHPELSVGDEEVPGYYRSTFLANERVREYTAPTVAAFRDAAESREAGLSALQYLSPALLAQRALYRLAQADAAASRHFLDSAGAKLAEISDAVGPAVISRNRISLQQYQQIAPLETVMLPVGAGPATGIAYLSGLALLLAVVAWRAGRELA